MPPAAVYAVLAALAMVENFFPPVPGDAVVALGAFLTVNGTLEPFTLFAVCWTANFVGATAVYLLARRVGGALFETRTGRRLLSPESIASLERGYIRYGLPGVFLGRMLPGVRAVVAPFAGLVRLPPVRALVPIGLASALWFAMLVVLGRYIGQSWEGIQLALRNLNTGLAVLGFVLAGTLAALWWRARAARRARLWDALRVALDHGPTPAGSVDPALQAVAAFVLEMAEADEHMARPEREALTARLRARFNHLPGQVSADRAAVEAVILRATSSYQASERRRLVDRMRRVAEADGVITPAEGAMIARAASLLGVDPA
ncbi:MAG TPA: VTT domain-containing protein [Gemmatimonadales bacterium]|nr:VTT domain-containing protein [Gemmatimonadales bacterium]